MAQIYVTDVRPITSSRVEIYLFIPDMSVRPLLMSCHLVYTSYEICEALGLDRLKLLLDAFVAKNPCTGRKILMQKAMRAHVRPQSLEGSALEWFWKAVCFQNMIAEKERYDRAKQASGDGYDADVDSDPAGCDPEAQCDPSDYDYPYEALGFGVSDDYVFL